MKSVKVLVYAIVSSATFGLVPFFALPAIHAGVAVNTVVFLRFFLSFLAMGVVLLIKGTSFKVTKNEYKMLCLLSIFYAATSMLLTLSYLYIPSGMATTIHFLYPLVVTLIMILFFREKLSVSTIAGIVGALAGVAILYRGGPGSIMTMTPSALKTQPGAVPQSFLSAVEPSGSMTCWRLFGVISRLV